MNEQIIEQVEAAAVVNADYQAHQDKAIIHLKFLAERLDPAGRAALEALEHDLAQAQGVAVRRAYLMGLEAAGKY